MKTKTKLFAQKIVPLIGIPDEELALHFNLTGDREAFEMIYRKYRHSVFNFVLALTKDRALAEELTHDIFLKLFRKIDMYQSDRKFSPWFWTLARNSVYDSFRKKDALNYRDDIDDVEELYINAETPEMLILKRAEIRDLRDCFSRLPSSQKEALSLKIYSDLSYQDIDKVMGRGISSIKSLLSRARKALAGCLEGKQNG